MRTRVQKWGNSLAVRIPRSFAAEVKLEQDSVVDVSLVDGKLVILPVSKPQLTLNDLLAGVTESNLHGEIDTGLATGKEVW